MAIRFDVDNAIVGDRMITHVDLVPLVLAILLFGQHFVDVAVNHLCHPVLLCFCASVILWFCGFEAATITNSRLGIVYPVACIRW